MPPYNYASSSTQVGSRSEFDILKASHKFLREDEEEEALSWDDRLARKYYSNLYREFAVCDLKHYKSGNFALRWRTEPEVISGAGETTCGNTRCPLHTSQYPDGDGERDPSLKTLELPFSYVEDGESKFALVKVVLCGRCLKKLMWKRNKEKEKERGREVEKRGEREEGVEQENRVHVKQEDEGDDLDRRPAAAQESDLGGGRTSHQSHKRRKEEREHDSHEAMMGEAASKRRRKESDEPSNSLRRHMDS